MVPHGSGRGIAEKATLSAFFLQHADLTAAQQQAIRTLFSHENSILALTGVSGSGKTHLIGPMMSLAQASGYQPILLTTQQAETVHLQQHLQKTPENLRDWVRRLWDKRQFDTVFRFIKIQEKLSAMDRLFQKKPMIFVDNATQLSLQQSNELREMTQRLKGRLVLIGDPQSTLSWRSGTPFTQMLENGLAVANLPNPARRVDSPLKAAVEKTVQGQIAAAFHKIDHRIVSIEEDSQRWETMAAHFAGLSAEKRKQSRVLAPTHSAAQTLNLHIREALKHNGELPQTEISIGVLLPRYMRLAEQHIARHYQTGQWLRFNQDYISLGVSRGDYRQITGVDIKNNHLLLANAAGRVRRWNPHKIPEGAIEVFDEKNRAIAVGDALIWQRADKKHGIYRGESVTVLKSRTSGSD